MSVKRQATTELNHDNWDQEDSNDPDSTEGFKTAPKEVLEKRVIRTAKRRSNLANHDGQKSSVFSGFGGFNKVQKTSFDFLANLTNGNKTNTPQPSSANNEETKSMFSSSTPRGLFSTGPVMSTTTTPSLFTKPVASSPTGNTFSPAEPAKESQNNSPFKIQTTLTPSNSFNTTTPATSISTPFSNAQYGINLIGPATSSPNAFAKSSPFKMTSTPSIFSVSPNKTDKSVEKNTFERKEDNEEKDNIDEKKLKYYKNIKGLNISVSDWIKKHVEETPLCILTPIFKDYEKHLKEIQDEYFNNTTTKSNGEQGDFKQNMNEIKASPTSTRSGLFSNNPLKSTTNKLTPEKQSGFSFGITSSESTQKTNIDKGFTFGNLSQIPNSTNSIPAKSTSGFAFGTTAATSSTTGSSLTTTTSTGFSFGVNSTPPNLSFPSGNPIGASGNGNSSFSFGSGKPFSFNSNIQNKPDESGQSNTNEDEDEPPKVEFTPLVEENSVFDKKCKIFFKKDGNFVDKGVGTLYIKKIEESKKHQLLVRANTSLGNILLNLVLGSSIPMQRMGKNNVMLVCIPTPDAKPPPTPVLIRVKTSEEADDLLEILNKYKI